MPVALVLALILSASTEFGQDYKTMERVAYCESRFDVWAKNPHSDASGLFQFMPRTFDHYAVKLYGFGPQFIWDPEVQARTAAYMFSLGEKRQWQCK